MFKEKNISGNPQIERKNPLKSEHLKGGEKPIIACIGELEQFPGHRSGIKNIDEFSGYGSLDVDYSGDPKQLSIRDFKNAGSGSYVISSIDNFDKLSTWFLNCTGLVVAGRSKETGENVSFLSHQDPSFFLREKNKDLFVKDLRERLGEVRGKCLEGTIDAAIIGGNYFRGFFSGRFRRNYLDSIKLLSAEVANVLGFEPIVMTGPKTVSGPEDVFYDNNERRLHMMRPKVGDASTKSYLPSDIEEQKKKWS
jgi:hypothetical protein